MVVLESLNVETPGIPLPNRRLLEVAIDDTGDGKQADEVDEAGGKSVDEVKSVEVLLLQNF